MFERITQAIDSMTGETHQVDPSRFNDPVALKTQWNMISKGGAGFGSHTLKNEGTEVLVFKLTYGVYILSAVLLSIWLIGSIVFWVNGFREVPPYLILILFGVLGIVNIVMSAKPIRFDKNKGLFIKGRLTKGEPKGTNSIRLDQIHALQVLARLVRDYDTNTHMDQSYISYELILVLHDATRKSVLRHGNRGLMLDDAETIANFLGVSVWDATS